MRGKGIEEFRPVWLGESGRRKEESKEVTGQCGRESASDDGGKVGLVQLRIDVRRHVEDVAHAAGRECFGGRARARGQVGVERFLCDVHALESGELERKDVHILMNHARPETRKRIVPVNETPGLPVHAADILTREEDVERLTTRIALPAERRIGGRNAGVQRAIRQDFQIGELEAVAVGVRIG